MRVLPQSVLDRLVYRKEPDGGKEAATAVEYAKHWALRIAMVIVAAIASAEVLSRFVKPLLRGYVAEPALGLALSVVGILVTGAFMANLFYGNRKGEIRLLWIGGKAASAVLVLSMLAGVVVSSLSIVFIIYVLEGVFSWWFVLLAFLLAALLARSRAIHSGFLRLESGFLGNLNENAMAERKAELDDEEHANWVEQRLYVVQVAATGKSSRLVRMRSADYLSGVAFNLDLVAIERDGRLVGEDLVPRLTKEDLGRRINDPDDPLGIREGDLLTFLGTEDEVDSYVQKLLKDDMIEEGEADSVTLEEYLRSGRAPREARCFSFSGPASEFGAEHRVDRLHGRLRQPGGGVRAQRRIVMKPSRNTILSQGDRVWVFADQVMAEPLLALLGGEGGLRLPAARRRRTGRADRLRPVAFRPSERRRCCQPLRDGNHKRQAMGRWA
ncbi:MAG: hypothetical protein ACLSVD_03465 [Eggerthellaceae bacterium]